MLEFFRKNIGGLMGFIIVGVLVFVFALSFGPQGEGWGKGQSSFTPATVGGEEITETSYRVMLNLMGGRAIGKDTAEYASLQNNVINALIERQLLLELAEKSGISATAAEVEDRVVKNEFLVTQQLSSLAERVFSPFSGLDPARAAEVLLRDGHRLPERFDTKDKAFDLELFRKFVQYQLQVTEENFIEEQRRELVAQRVREAVVAGVGISEAEVRRAYDKENDNVSISFIRLYPSHFASALAPTPEELAAYAAANKDAVQQYYDTNKFKYTNLEKQARARHILVKVDEAAGDDVKAEKRALIDGLLARVKGGEDFATLAKEFSEDEGSKGQGGDLGYNARGRMVKEFDEAMFALSPGQVSDVVATQYGFHIIKLEGMREGNVSLEDATAEIAEQLYRDSEGTKRAKAAADEYLARLKAGESIDALIPAPAPDAEEKPGQLQVSTTPPFARGATTVPGIGNAPEIAAAAFTLTKEKPFAEKVFDVRGDHFLIALKERTTPNDAEFAKQKDEMAERMLAQKRASWLLAFVRDLRKAADKDGRIESAIITPAQSAREDAESAADDKAPSASEKDGEKKSDKPAADPKPEEGDEDNKGAKPSAADEGE